MKTIRTLFVLGFLLIKSISFAQSDGDPKDLRNFIDKKKINFGLIQSFQNEKPSTGLILQYLLAPNFEFFAEGGFSRFAENNFHANDRFIAPGHWYGLGSRVKLRLHPKNDNWLVKPKLTTSIGVSHGVSNIVTFNHFEGNVYKNYMHKSTYPNYRSTLMQVGVGMEWRFRNDIVIHAGLNLNGNNAQYNYDEEYASPESQFYGNFPIVYHPKSFGRDVSFEYCLSIPLWKKLKPQSKK
jgi:hypothetical protein